MEAQEGRMFRPLAMTKTFAMVAASLLSIAIVPALMTIFIRGKRLQPESRNPISTFYPDLRLDYPAGPALEVDCRSRRPRR
jgi:Cu/Ag efflux pump CusA